MHLYKKKIASAKRQSSAPSDSNRQRIQKIKANKKKLGMLNGNVELGPLPLSQQNHWLA